MRRVLVIGSGGAGKSTFAARLGERTGLPVIHLDSLFWRVLKRRARFRGRARPDMAEGCHERLTREFVRWIWTYPRERRPGVLKRLGELGGGRRVFVLRSPREAGRFLEESGRVGAFGPG